jgi:hypothetical protein
MDLKTLFKNVGHPTASTNLKRDPGEHKIAQVVPEEGDSNDYHRTNELTCSSQLSIFFVLESAFEGAISNPPRYSYYVDRVKI